MYSLTKIFKPKFILFLLLIKYITCDYGCYYGCYCGRPGKPHNAGIYTVVSSIKSGVIIYIFAESVLQIEFKYGNWAVGTPIQY